MKEKKIVSGDRVSWYQNDDTQLDYRMVFDEEDSISETEKDEASEDEKEEKVDALQLLRKRDDKWKKRLKRTRKESFKKGFKKGEQQGAERVRKEMEETFDRLETMFNEAHKEWCKRHDAINPGLLDLVFDLVESIVDLPIKHPKMKEKLKTELSPLLHAVDKNTKPVLTVSEYDYNFVADLVNKYAPDISVDIRKNSRCKPGEFEFDTDKKTVIHNFRKMAKDFRENLSLPTWQ